MSLKPDKPESMIRDKLMENEHTGKYLNKAEGMKKAALTPPSSWGKRPVPLLLGLLTAWIVGGAYAYRILCCLSPAAAFPLLITDGAGTDAVVVAAADENMRFAKADATPYISDAKIESELMKAAEYLKGKDDKMLVITGKYNANELTDGDSSNLGLARALNVKDLFVGWGLDSNRIIPRGEASKLIIPVKDTVYGGVGFAIQDIPNRYMKFTAGDLDINADNNLAFGINSAKIEQPVPEGVKSGAKQLADYFKTHPNQTLQITGWYGVQENAGTDDLNLGRARANALRDWWISMGVPSGQVEVIGAEQRNDLAFVNGKLYGGASYNISGLPEGGIEGANAGDSLDAEGNPVLDAEGNPIAKVGADGEENGDGNDADKDGENSDGKDANGEDITIPPIVNIYFDKNSDLPNMSADENDKLAMFVKYLKAFADKNVVIKGYASAEGSAAYNKALSERRAKAVSKYLVSKGVKDGQIKVDAIGATVTTAKDDSEAERSKDRRAELTIPN